MKSKRIWVAKDYDVGYKSKSHMAEFSPNPDGRNKRDTSFKEYKKRLNIEEDIRMKNRIAVNKLRDNQKLPPFLERNKYEEIVEESELEGQDLIDFLINYNMKNSLEENIEEFKKKVELTECSICKVDVRKDKLEKHNLKEHKLITCLICHVPVREDRFKKHNLKVHQLL